MPSGFDWGRATRQRLRDARLLLALPQITSLEGDCLHIAKVDPPLGSGPVPLPESGPAYSQAGNGPSTPAMLLRSSSLAAVSSSNGCWIDTLR